MKMSPKNVERFKKELRKPRERFMEELKYEWLSDLLDAYHISDAGAKVQLDSQIRKTQRDVVCKKGCYACCVNPTVPINQVELMGLSWYVSERMDADTYYNKLTHRLDNHNQTTECPFLLDGSCSVHPVRPLACRTFYVFDVPCALYEDVSVTRPEDIVPDMNPIEAAWAVSQKMMNHLGIQGIERQEEAFQLGFMMKCTRPIHTFDWIEFRKSTDYNRERVADGN